MTRSEIGAKRAKNAPISEHLGHIDTLPLFGKNLMTFGKHSPSAIDRELMNAQIGTAAKAI